MYKRHLLLAGVEVCLRKGYVEKVHPADYLNIKRFKREEIQDGLGRVGAVGAFLFCGVCLVIFRACLQHPTRFVLGFLDQHTPANIFTR